VSKAPAAFDAVLEWGPSHAVVMDLQSRTRRAGSAVSEAAMILNGRRDVVAAVSRRAAFIRAVRVPDVSRDEVNQILRMQLTGLFPVPESELAFDFRLTDDVDGDGRLAVVGAMRETDLLRLHAEAKESGLKVRRVVPAAFGSMVVARALGLPTCAVVQPTVEGIAIDIISEGELRYTRVTPASSDAASVEAEVLRTFVAAGVEGGPIVATEGIHLPRAIDAKITPLEALGSAEAETLHLNLEPTEVIIARERNRVNARNRIAVLFCVVALLLAAVVYMNRTDAQTKVDRTDKARAKVLADAKKLKDSTTKRAAAASDLSKIVTQAFEPGQTLSDVMTLITQDAPAGVWLDGVVLQRGRPITIRGTALNDAAQQAFLQKLTSETQRLREVKLVTYTNAQIETKPVVQFVISAFPIGNIPVLEPRSTMQKQTTVKK